MTDASVVIKMARNRGPAATVTVPSGWRRSWLRPESRFCKSSGQIAATNGVNSPFAQHPILHRQPLHIISQAAEQELDFGKAEGQKPREQARPLRLFMPRIGNARAFDSDCRVCRIEDCSSRTASTMDATLKKSLAEVAELADAHGSGPCTRKGVGVRVPSSAPSVGPSLSSGFRLRAPAPLTPAKRLKFESLLRHHQLVFR